MIIESILLLLIVACIVVPVYNCARLQRSTPWYLDDNVNPIKPIVTIYTFKDGTKVYVPGNGGKKEVELPKGEENKDGADNEER